MLEFHDPGAATMEESVANAASSATKASKRALDFVFGAQKAFLEQMVFAANEVLDRACTEMHLLAEFGSKMAAAHSVTNIKTMYEECSQHQIDFIRRDSERLFKHGKRMVETTSNLLNFQSQD